MLSIFQKHIEERSLLNSSQFGFRASHSTTLHNVWGQRTTWPFISTVSLRPRCSWTWKRPSIPHGTLNCYISYLNWNFRPVWSSSFAPFFHTANSCFGRRRNVSRGASRFSPIPYLVQHIYKWCPPNSWCSPSPVWQWNLCTRQIERRVLLSENSSAVSAQWGPGVSAGILK
jgi:hypothetical protein